MSRQKDHGTIKSYVVGFVLSLIFTFIPYYLVVSKSISGNLLLVTILAFAVIQMIIQVTFFLHLGRGPKPKWNLFFFISTVGIILVILGGSIMIIDNLHYNMLPSDQTKKLVSDEGIYQIDGERTGACKETKANHKVTIKNNQVTPGYSLTNKCDTLTFISEDPQISKITFGTHPEHGTYAGERELTVRKGRSKTITLSEPGSYKFHDHLDPSIAGEFTVSP